MFFVRNLENRKFHTFYIFSQLGNAGPSLHKLKLIKLYLHPA